MKRVLRLFIIALLVFVSSTVLSAQSRKCGTNTLLFHKNHVSIESGFSVLRVMPLEEVGAGSMQLSHRPGMFLGFKYHININDYFALRMGTIAGLHTFRFDFVPGLHDSLVFSPARMSVAKPYLSVPIELNVRYRFRQRHILGAIAGIAASFMAPEKLSAAASLSGNPQGGEIYRMELQYKQHNPFVTIDLGLEYLWVLRNMDMVKLCLKYSIGTGPIFHAKYEHKENDLRLSYGSFTSFNDHLGLSIGYVFTRVNKLTDRRK